MASIYCQELIRNSLYLCQAYIGDMLTEEKDKQKEEAKLQSEGNQLLEHYYVESDQGLLKLLTENCLPILKDMLS